MNSWVSGWTKKRYKEVCKDLCTCFIKRGFSLSDDRGYEALITSDTCMYISSFEKMRKEIIKRTSIVCFIDTRGTNAHPDVFDANAGWVLWNHPGANIKGSYFKLNHPIPEKQAGLLEALANPDCGWFYRADANGFEAIPGSPIAYWVSASLRVAFKQGQSLEHYALPKKGLGTGNKELFMRCWWEIGLDGICFDARNVTEAQKSRKRWFPHNKGGEFRKWYGNDEYVVDWEHNGSRIKAYHNEAGQLAARPQNQDEYFKPCISWSKISSGKLAFRYKPVGSIFNEVAPAFFSDRSSSFRLEAFLNSSVCAEVAKAISPTLDFQVGQVASYPVLQEVLESSQTSAIVESLTVSSRNDWDSFETSYGFKRHPLA